MKGWIIFRDVKRRMNSGAMPNSFTDANKNRGHFGLKQRRNKSRIYELITCKLPT